MKLTHDASAAENTTTAEIDERARLLLEMEDPGSMVGLRDHSPGHPSKYETLWQAADTYLHEVAEDCCPWEKAWQHFIHGSCSLSQPFVWRGGQAMCCRLAKTITPVAETPVLAKKPNNQGFTAAHRVTDWRSSSWSNSGSSESMWGQPLYLSYFWYQREMAVMFRSHAWFVSQDDKHKVKVGETGTPVAAVERGKEVTVGLDTSFQVTDHDFTQLTLTPSVTVMINVPGDTEGNLYKGKVHVGL